MAPNLRDLNEEFIQYCQKNELEKVRASLTLEVDVNTVSENGSMSCLTIAAYKNNSELLDVLLSTPAINVNQTIDAGGVHEFVSGRQWTALMIACCNGNSNTVSRLVKEEGLDFNYQDNVGYSAAIWASANGHTECVRVLAQTGKVDWNVRNRWGQTPLYLALYFGHSDIVDILVWIPGIDFNVKRKTGETLAQAAVKNGVVRSVDTFANQEKFDCWNVSDKNGDTPVMMAFKSGKTDIVQILVGCPRVDLTIRDKEGWTLVMRTIAGKELCECWDCLTPGNANCHCSDLTKIILARLDKSYTGSTLARIAVEVLEEEDIKVLFQSEEVDWNETVENEDPAILWSLNNDKLNLVRLLLESPTTNINIRDREGWSFLVRAISKQDLGEKT